MRPAVAVVALYVAVALILALTAAPASHPARPVRLIPPLVVRAEPVDVDRSELARVNRGIRREDPPPTVSTTSTSSTSTTRPPRPAPSIAAPKAVHPAGARSLLVRVTCYGPPAFPAGQHTATGAPVGPGSLAVDPRVIPLGSTVTVDGLGTFRADDTGGAIRGAHVDAWRSSCAGWPNPTLLAHF